MTLEPLTASNMEKVREWRHQFRETLRTPYMLTESMQQDYYKNVICNRDSNTRYFALYEGWNFIGYGGLENISWENGNAEISLLIGPEHQRKGCGRIAVELFLREAFFRMRLNAVHGECYECGPWRFWEKFDAEAVWLPARKFWNGMYYPSYYFTFFKADYLRLIEAKQ